MALLDMPRADRPAVSIVLVTYGQWPWVQRALRAVRNCTEPCYEVIVVDNASPDGTTEKLRSHVTGVNLVCNERNVGFGPAANQGARYARAPLVLFLNSDAVVTDGWLPAMVEAMDRWTRTAVVVPRLLNLDGTLQEAGCIIGCDGTTQSLGYGDDPERTYYRFPRTVDYGSAACMLVRREAFEEVGGFDPAYAPAYCEDVDLCFSMWERDWKVVYEPGARVFHARGASLASADAQRLIEEHTALLRQRWSTVLQRRPSLAELPRYAHRVAAARDARQAERVLVMADEVPFRDEALEALPQQPETRVTLAAQGGETRTDAIDRWLRMGIEVVAGSIDWCEWSALRRWHYDTVVEPDMVRPEWGIVPRMQSQARLAAMR